MDNSGKTAVLDTINAVKKDGKIELLEQIEIPEGASTRVTVLAEDVGIVKLEQVCGSVGRFTD